LVLICLIVSLLLHILQLHQQLRLVNELHGVVFHSHEHHCSLIVLLELRVILLHDARNIAVKLSRWLNRIDFMDCPNITACLLRQEVWSRLPVGVGLVR
jgi:hypothetical protein